MRRFSLRSPREKPGAPDTAPAYLVLLVEDNPADSVLVQKAFEEHAFSGELAVVDDGEKAIRLIQSLDAEPLAGCPDLVIIDLNLPRRSGREVLEAMRRSEKCRDTPVVVLSSSEAAQDRMDAARLGATRYFRKPSRLEDFLALGATFQEVIASRT